MKRELVAQVTGRVQGQVFLKSAGAVGAVIVLHELDFLGVGVVDLHGPVQELGVVGLGFGRRDLHVALARVGVVGQQDVAHASAHVLLVFFAGGVGFGQNRGQHVVQGLAGPLAKAQAHHVGFGRRTVHVEYVLRVGQVFAREGADAPQLLQPGVTLASFNT